jgi:hypothetical protein
LAAGAVAAGVSKLTEGAFSVPAGAENSGMGLEPE